MAEEIRAMTPVEIRQLVARDCAADQAALAREERVALKTLQLLIRAGVIQRKLQGAA